MKIDAISFGAFTPQTQQIQDVQAEKTSSPLDTFDETRFANAQANEQKVSNPIEQQSATIEDLMTLQQSTDQMARSFGFPNAAAAAEATSPVSAGSDSSMSVVSAVSGSSSNVNV